MSSLNNLRKWFLIHFTIDIAAAVPLVLIPETVLSHLGWETIDPIATRLVAAALFAIGIESYRGRNTGIQAYISMLNLKITWSTVAIFGIILSLIQGLESDNFFLWMLGVIFVIFNLVWIYWRSRINKVAHAKQLGE